jgi:hypothetical protein
MGDREEFLLRCQEVAPYEWYPVPDEVEKRMLGKTKRSSGEYP